MNFDLTSEQQMLQDSVRRFVEREYQPEARAALVRARRPGSRPHWLSMADSGWLAAAIPESLGGLGGSVVDSALIAHELGRGLVVEPYLGLAVLGAQALVAAGPSDHATSSLSRIAEGRLSVALAYSEGALRGMSGPFATRARTDGSRHVLDGTKTLVIGGAVADTFVVAAESDAGPALFLVDAKAPGVRRIELPLQDGSWAIDLVLDDVRLEADALLCAGDRASAALQHALGHGIAVLGAELIGVMERAIEITLDYVRVRKQFGAAIGQFQSVQHRIADMSAEMEYARSMLFALLKSFHRAPDAAVMRLRSSAKASICRAAKSVCAQAIQLHGGIGMTDEYVIGHHYQRAVVADRLLGGSERHEARAATLLQAEVVSLSPEEQAMAPG